MSTAITEVIPMLSRPLALAALAVTLGGCVTINIYFPAAAAEKAADRIIDEVWQLKNGTPDGGASEPAAGADTGK